MKSIRKYRQNQLFWMEFLIMLGVLLLIVTMTLVSLRKAHDMSRHNEAQLEACITMENLMAYCKVNQSSLKQCLENLGAVNLEEIPRQSKWLLFYDQNWQIVKEREASSYQIEINIKEETYTHAHLVTFNMNCYIAGKAPILTLEGNTIVREEEDKAA